MVSQDSQSTLVMGASPPKTPMKSMKVIPGSPTKVLPASASPKSQVSPKVKASPKVKPASSRVKVMKKPAASMKVKKSEKIKKKGGAATKSALEDGGKKPATRGSLKKPAARGSLKKPSQRKSLSVSSDRDESEISGNSPVLMGVPPENPEHARKQLQLQLYSEYVQERDHDMSFGYPSFTFRRWLSAHSEDEDVIRLRRMGARIFDDIDNGGNE